VSRCLRSLAVLALLASCDGSPRICAPGRSAGGVFVVRNSGCTIGCEQIRRGDVILAIDGEPILSPDDVDRHRLAGGVPHRLHVRRFDEACVRRIEIVVHVEDGEPFLVADAIALMEAPEWARRRLFAHASPTVELVGIDGERIDGRSMLGRRHLVVYWDHADRVEESAAVVFMQVLQLAQADLLARDVHIVFAHVSFPWSRRAPMTVEELRAWTDRWAVVPEGHPLPGVPAYRAAEPREHEAAGDRGREADMRVLENLGQSPTIVLLDARGLVRWHSEGVQPPPSDAAIQNAEQYTIIAAVLFALANL
jgi:hypothetical protein